MEKLCHCVFHCGAYRRAGLEQKIKIVRDGQLCVVCLSDNHHSSGCENKSSVCGLEGCKKRHHPDLHGSTDPYDMSVNYISTNTAVSTRKTVHRSSYAKAGIQDDGVKRRVEEMEEIERIVGLPPIPGEQVLLLFQGIKVVYGPDRTEDQIKTFWDDGSTCSLVKDSTAERLQLRGEPVTITIDTINGKVERKTRHYVVELIDSSGRRILVCAFGVEKISGVITSIDISGVKTLFSMETQQKWSWLADRPEGDIELLVGSELAGLHPDTLEKVGDLKVMKSQFGHGLLLTGRHPSISVESVFWPESVSAIRQGRFRMMEGAYMVKKQAVSISKPRDFYAGEEMGVYCPKRCNKCKSCTECPFSNRMLSEREQFEYNLMERGVEHDEREGVFRVSYPFLQDPRSGFDRQLGAGRGYGHKLGEEAEERRI